MHSRASQLISELGLAPHPEGGYFRQIHRSGTRVQPRGDGRGERAALTTIYFLLTAGDISRWHRVLSDEVWHYYEGSPLELFSMDPELGEVRREILGPFGEEVRPARVISANRWQAARSTGDYTLVGCSVGPGFEFEDFELLGERAEVAKKLRHRHPEWVMFL